MRLKLKLEYKPTGLPPDIEYNLVRIAQEAITNSVKHSGARTVEVSLGFTPKAAASVGERRWLGLRRTERQEPATTA